ncbi:XRE family transcriptional regulator [Mycolicibacterium sp. CBMA 226]|uniref:XRE family transcriptional regulator n=1 Tax=Mycolicibacterium sp. CBMA 226 TaxID=2606611 RepID=UPI0012DFCDFA|nr:XRE family transcriptional regulator [Mycolicibacterium sp. CBMA 226]
MAIKKPSVDAATFAERLNRLFAVVYPPGRGPYRNFEVTEALSDRGYRLSAPYLSQLRSGKRACPSLRTAEMLAEFFGVEAEYFDTDTRYARALDIELDWLDLAHDQSVRDLTTALITLTPRQRDEVLGRPDAREDHIHYAEPGSETTAFFVMGQPSRPAAPAGCAQA